MALWQAFDAVVAAHPDKLALCLGEQALTFRALRHLALGQAAALARQGVQPGDRVVVQLPNGPAAAALPLAIAALGAVPVLVPAEASAPAIADRTGARLCLTEPPIPTDPLPQPRPPAGIGSILFTSGSTGRPKGVMQHPATLIDGVDRVARAVGYGASDRLLCAVPFAHDYGWGQLLSLYRLGLTLILAPPGLGGLAEAIARHRPTVLGGVPSLYAALAKGMGGAIAGDSLRLVMSTGSAMPHKIWEALPGLFPEARRCLNYGLTETFRSATLRPEDEALAPVIVGSALPGSALAIVDAAGTPLPPGEWGEVVHRGAGAFAGYWDDPAQTALRLRPDPVTGQGLAVFTADRGALDESGRLRIGDRIDRMVKVMGVLTSPAAVEAALREVPGVEAAAVIARPHDILGAELVAVLVGPEAAVAAARKATLALAQHERPRVWQRAESLPLTAAGKVDLVRLAAMVG